MRIIYRAENLVDAHLVKDALDQAGIPCFINGEYLLGGIGQLPARDLVAVSVPDVCVEAAESVVRGVVTRLESGQSERSSENLASGLQPDPA